MQSNKEKDNQLSPFEQFTELTLAFLRCENPISPVPEDAVFDGFWCITPDEQAALIAKLLTRVRNHKFPFLIRQVDLAFRISKSDLDPAVTKRRDLLKWHLAGKTHRNWKDALYGSLAVDRSSCRMGSRLLDHDANHLYHIGYQEKTSPVTWFTGAPNAHFTDCRHVIIGNTFATNQPSLLEKMGSVHDNQPATAHREYPDAADSGFIINQHRRCIGIAFALAHTSTPPSVERKQLHHLARTCRFAVRHSIRLASQSYNDPENFKADLPTLAKNNLQEELYLKTQNAGERIELLTARSFLVDRENIRLIGMNIGQSILVGWNHYENKVYPISAGRIGKHKNQFVPILIPSKSAQGIPDLRIFDITVPSDTLFIALSHGLWENLPTQQRTHFNGIREYVEYTLDASWLKETLADCETSRSCTNKLTELGLHAHVQDLRRDTERANDAEDQYQRQRQHEEQRIPEIFANYDTLSQHEMLLQQQIIANNHQPTKAHIQQQVAINQARQQLNTELQELEKTRQALDQARFFSRGDNLGILTMQMPGRTQPFPKNRLPEPVHRPRELNQKVMRVHNNLMQRINADFDQACSPSLYQFFFQPRTNTVRRLRRLNRIDHQFPEEFVCFYTLQHYYNYLYAEHAAISNHNSPVYKALDAALQEIVAFMPNRRWLDQDQECDEDQMKMFKDPKTNREVASNLLRFADEKERSWYNFGINAGHYLLPFHPNQNKRNYHRHGLTAITTAAGSFAVKIAKCEHPNDYHYWIGCAESYIDSLFEDNKAHQDFCQLLVEQIALIEVNFPRQRAQAVQNDALDTATEPTQPSGKTL